MNSHLPAPDSAPPPRRNWTRRLVNLLVALVVVAVAAATFVFSYSGVHAIALFGGVSAQLARYYPGLFDAVLVIACVAAVVLRDGRWWARLWAWLVIVVLLAAIAVTDVLHAMNYALRPRLTEGIVAAAPVAAVLLAFSLLLTMLRQSRSQPPHGTGQAGLTGGRTRGAGGQPAPATLEIPSLPAAEASTVEIPALGPSPQLRQPAPSIALPIALPAAFTPPPPAAETAISMPAPGADGAARTAADKAANSVPDEPAETVPDSVPTREEPAIAGEREAEPPTVLTPAAAEAPAVPGTPAAPPATAASKAPVVPEVPAGPEAAQPPAGPDGAGPDGAEPDEASEAAAPSPAEPASASFEAATAASPPEHTPSGAASSDTARSGSAPSDIAPSGAPEPPTAPVPVPARPPGGIRYAGGAAPKTARPEADEPSSEAPSAEQAPRGGSPADYWDGEEASPYAGQVYPARDEHADTDTDGRANGNGNGNDGYKDGDDGSASAKQPPRRQPPELDDDAPPFATAPFAPVPRLNRVRSMPVPPADDEE